MRGNQLNSDFIMELKTTFSENHSIEMMVSEDFKQKRIVLKGPLSEVKGPLSEVKTL